MCHSGCPPLVGSMSHEYASCPSRRNSAVTRPDSSQATNTLVFSPSFHAGFCAVSSLTGQSKSSTEHLKIEAILGNIPALGKASPVSHFATVERSTPNFSARPFCVKFAASLKPLSSLNFSMFSLPFNSVDFLHAFIISEVSPQVNIFFVKKFHGFIL